MDDIVASIRKQSESLEIKHENTWDLQGDVNSVPVVSNLNGNILQVIENTHTVIDKHSQETTTNNAFLIDLEIGDKTVENVAIRHDCLLQDIAEELAENEMVKVVYFLHEKIKKGGDNCDASEAQVLVKLRSNWKWLHIDELVDNLTMTFGEAFSDIPNYFKPVFSLAPKVKRKSNPSNVSQATTPSTLVSSTGLTVTTPSISNAEEHGSGLLSDLTDVLAKHNASQLSKKDSQLGKDVLLNLTLEATQQGVAKEKVNDLKKHITGLDTILKSSAKSSMSKQQHQNRKQPSQINNTAKHDATETCTSNQHRIHPDCLARQESFDENSSLDISDEKHAAPLSRQRTIFDPLNEVPRLKEWFEGNPAPKRSVINRYVDELNAAEIRRGKTPVTDKAVYIWFKNARARRDRNKSLG